MAGQMNSLHYAYVQKARQARRLGRRGLHRVTINKRTGEIRDREHVFSCWCFSRGLVANPQVVRCPQHGNVIAHARGRKDHGLGNG